jgi:hypothetical protein
MAVTNLGRTYQSSVSVSLSGNPPKTIQNYTQTWLIKIDDPCTEEGYIGTAPGLPFVGQREDVGGVTWICESREFQESTSAPGLYTVTIQWTTDISKFTSSKSKQGNNSGGGGGGGGEEGPTGGGVEPLTDLPEEDEGGEDDGEVPPWLKAARWSTQTSWFKERPSHAYYHGFTGGIRAGSNLALGSTGQQVMPIAPLNGMLYDADGYPAFHPLLSSNGQPIKNYENDNPNITYTCKKSVKPGPLDGNGQPSWLIQMCQPKSLGSCNWAPLRMPVLNKQYGTCYVKYAGLSIEESYYQDVQYFEISLQFDTNLKIGGWRTGFYDEGDMYWANNYQQGSTDKQYQKIKLDENGQPVRVALNGFGGELGEGQEPVVNWFSMMKPYDMGGHLFNLRRLTP